MIVLGALVDPTEMPSGHFDEVAETTIREVFLFESPAVITQKKQIDVTPRFHRNDVFLDKRYAVTIDDEERLNLMKTNLDQYVNRPGNGHTLESVWFKTGPGTTTAVVNKKHVCEIRNIQALASVVGLENVKAPKQQNQTVDIIYHVVERPIKVSIKSATVSNNSDHEQYHFHLQKKVNSQWCDVVMTFYRDSHSKPIAVSVIKADRVYNTSKSKFCWSKSTNADILSTQIRLADGDAKVLLDAEIKRILNIDY